MDREVKKVVGVYDRPASKPGPPRGLLIAIAVAVVAAAVVFLLRLA
jgi:hypothetical protein